MNEPASGVRELALAYVPQSPEPVLTERDVTRERVTGIVGHVPAIRLLREQLACYAPTNATVVVLGETGTGKELVARALPDLSPRAKRPFVAANVAAISESMLLSELFGHERGAFTGAHARHHGLFEQAHNGTLFLDEVGDPRPSEATLTHGVWDDAR